jgi:hypothetical protein
VGNHAYQETAWQSLSGSDRSQCPTSLVDTAKKGRMDMHKANPHLAINAFGGESMKAEEAILEIEASVMDALFYSEAQVKAEALVDPIWQLFDRLSVSLQNDLNLIRQIMKRLEVRS